jgi:uncharacterized membrane protein
MELFFAIKWLHILSATVLFGSGLATALYLFAAHRTGDPATIAPVARLTARADIWLTGTSGIVQPASGLLLVYLGGYGFFEPWLVAAYLLYALAFACWAPVVVLQFRARDYAVAALERGEALPPAYHCAMRGWFVLGWPAFIALLITFWLMITKPVLW